MFTLSPGFIISKRIDGFSLLGSSEKSGQMTQLKICALREGRRQEFLDDMLEQRLKRETEYGRHIYLLEPHIKESCGGFRDIQSMVWTAQVVFGLKDLLSLQEAGLLSQEELKR